MFYKMVAVLLCLLLLFCYCVSVVTIYATYVL